MRFALLASLLTLPSAVSAHHKPVFVPTEVTITAPAIPKPTISVPADVNGQYDVVALINHNPVMMLVDTGATDVSLSEADAASLDLPAGGRVQRYVTANSSIMTCRVVNAETIEVGQVTAHDVSVSICKSSSDLLGAGFIDKVKMSIVGNVLTFDQP